ncbi:hypothetical protein DFP73DRAFT_622650 [Morchella snyderi]|nr:hypothetical protein DFP73DRAFT_622650 [Morchella snyderi]
MSNKVQEWLQRGEITSTRGDVHQRYRKPVDIYTIGSDSVEDAMHTTLIAARKQENTLRKHHKKILSSDSSVIPFAEINPARYRIMNDVVHVNDNGRSEQRYQDVRETSREISAKVDGRRTKDFQRRSRHKMRSPSQTNPIAEPKRERKRAPANKKKESKHTHLKDKKQGDIITDEFSADNFTKDRLTLRPTHNLGIYKKGRTSTPAKKGLPDLAFSEMKFLDGRSFDVPIIQKASPEHNKDKKSRNFKEGNGPFSYFESSERRVGEKGLRTIIISSDGYTEPRKRRRNNDKSTPEKPSTETIMMESLIRPSPRSAMADVLRRRGIYSLPANISSRGSNCGSAITSGRNRGEESSDENFSQKKDIDELSEYSRAGYQKRFQPEKKEPVRLQKRGTSGPTLETLKEAHNAKSKESESSYASSVVIKDKKSEVEGVDRARGHAPEIEIMNSRSPAPKHIKWCTSDPTELIQKIPGSSSPLAALLRVCADSPERLGLRKRHDNSRDDKVGRKGRQSSKIPQRPVFYPQKSVSSQPSVYQDRPGRPTRPLGVTLELTRQLAKMEGHHQQWNHPEKPMNNHAIPPHALCVKADRYPLNEIQQNEESRGFDISGQVMAENYENEKHSDHYADNYPESPFPEAIGGQCSLNLTPHRYIKDSDGRKEFIEDSFMDSSSEYAPEDWAIDDTDRCRLNGSSEGRQIHELGHAYTADTVLGRGRSPIMNEGQCNIEESRYSNGGYVEQVLEEYPGPRRESFWRKHTL